jgi:toxin ParE1/3/4
MTELRVRPEAELDVFAAASWYEGERVGLGAAFLGRVRSVFARIESGPTQFPIIHSDVRRALLVRFPFGAFFFVDGATAVVIAVMHLHREPSSWRRRR